MTWCHLAHLDPKSRWGAWSEVQFGGLRVCRCTLASTLATPLAWPDWQWVKHEHGT